MWRLIFLVSHADIDNNGFLDQNDFECMALRACIIEGKGDCNPAKLSEFQHIMRSLWDEISDLADFDKVKNIEWNYFVGSRDLSPFHMLISITSFLKFEYRMAESVMMNSKKPSRKLASERNTMSFHK